VGGGGSAVVAVVTVQSAEPKIKMVALQDNPDLRLQASRL